MARSTRTLIYVPIIHTDPDLGSLASDVEEKAVRLLGERWKGHKRIIEQYWKEIFKYFKDQDVRNFKIFQDSLPVGGEVLALKLVDKLAKTGSPNYRLLKRLTDQGAILQKTEDVALLKQEYQLTKELIAKKPLLLAFLSFLNYKLKKERLLKARDNFIAQQINQKLEKEETGICFLGAYHEVLPKLAMDINIVFFKKPEKVKKYYQYLSKKRKERNNKLGALACYLTRPIKQSLVIRFCQL